MEQIILNLIKLQNQLRVLHWQTESYAQHQAFGQTYEALDGLLDELVEVHQGKKGKITFSSPVSIELVNLEDLSIEKVLEEVGSYLSTTFNELHDSETDTDCLNIRDEILAAVNKLRYLLTLK
jgi:DNA-binding ferritin-like protein